MCVNRIAVGVLAPLMIAGCLVAPGPEAGGVVFAPPLPVVVVLDAENCYYNGGYYYYYRNDGWYYSRSRGGPLVGLPRDRYPREARLRNGGVERFEVRTEQPSRREAKPEVQHKATPPVEQPNKHETKPAGKPDAEKHGQKQGTHDKESETKGDGVQATGEK